MKLFLIMTFILTTSSYSCEIILNKYMYIFNNNSISDYIKKRSSQCSTEQQKALFNVINQTSGTINTSFLQIPKTKISPSIIKIVTEVEILKKALSLTDDFKVSNVNRSIPGDNIYSDNHESFQVECSDCNNLGVHNYTIINHKNKGWGELTLLKKKFAFVANGNIKAFNNNLSSDNFIKRSLFGQKNKSNYVTNIEDLKFYKINRNLKKNKPLLKNMLSPKTLVKYGDIVKVTAKTTNLRLSIKAQAKSKGNFGDIIQLKNLNSNKIITGKVTNFNEVEIRL